MFPFVDERSRRRVFLLSIPTVREKIDYLGGVSATGRVLSRGGSPPKGWKKREYALSETSL